MIFWIVAGALTAGVVAGLLMPLLRRPPASIDRGAYDLAVGRDQLAEVDRDLARGEIGAEQAAAARTEIERRLLAIASAADAPAGTEAETAQPRPTARRLVGVILAITVPAATVGAYLFLGTPGAPSQPFAERRTTPDAATQTAPAMAQMAERLTERLAAAPDDRDAWILLARTYTELRRFADAARAYGQAIEAGFDEAEMFAARGEALIAAADGTVVPEARQAFAAALERNPDQPRARYYAGLALAQDGRLRDAMDLWTAVLRESPAQAPWSAFIAGQIRRAASSLGEEPPPEAAETVQPQAPPATAGAPGPSQADVEAAGAMSAEERTAFIRTMVARLASRMEEEPGDLKGWLRLTRAYGVLGEVENAKETLARAEALLRDLPADAPERAAAETDLEATRQALPMVN